MPSWRRVPSVIRPFFAVDLLLAAGYVLDGLANHPSWQVRRLLDLGEETGLGTWYSSVQWFCVAAAMAAFVAPRLDVRAPRTWRLALFPLAFLAFSVDEVCQLHESLGDIANKKFTHLDKLFPISGLWFLVIGIPFIVASAWFFWTMRSEFKDHRSAFLRIACGLGVMFMGAVGIEFLGNFVGDSESLGMLEVVSEEGCEMIGATIALWGACELLDRHAFTLRLDV